jgi:hypothetical protein
MNFLGGPGNNDMPENIGFFRAVATLTTTSSGVPVQIDAQLPANSYTVDPASISPAAGFESSSDVAWQTVLAPGSTTAQQFQMTGQAANMAPGEVRQISTGTIVTATLTAGTGGPGLTDFAVGVKNEFGTLDLRTGVFTKIGTVTNPQGGSMFGDLARMSGGTLFGMDSASDLVTIDPATGHTTVVGNSGNDIVGLAFSPVGTLFGISPPSATGPNDLYAIDPSTGAATLIGNMGPETGSVADIRFNQTGTLYWVVENQGESTLYTVNSTTGHATEVGPTNFDVTSLDFQAGTLYGFTTKSQIVALNTATGAGTLVAAEDPAASIFAATTAASSAGQGLTYTLALPPLAVAAEHIISIDPATQTGARNATVAYNVTLTNPLSNDVTYMLSTSGLAAYTVDLASSVDVPAGQMVTVPLSVMIPAGAIVGSQVFEVIAQTASGAVDSVEGQLTVAANVVIPQSAVNVALTPAQASAGQGTTAVYTLTVTNVGEATDTYALSGVFPMGVTANFSPSTITVPPGVSNFRDATLTLTPQPGTAPGSDPFTVTATSSTDATATGTASGTLNILPDGVQVMLNPSSGAPGDTLQMTVTNTGMVTDTFNLALGGPAALVAQLAQNQVTLAPGAAANVAITTSAVNFAVPGSLPLLGLATSQTNPAIEASATADLSISGTQGLTAQLQPGTQTLSQPGTASYLLLVNNIGNLEDADTATITGTTGAVTASLMGLDGQPTHTIPIFRLPGLASGVVELQTSMAGAGHGTVTVEVSSLNNPSITADSTATLIVNSINTMTAVTSDHAAGSTYGQAVTFTATVSSSGGTPTGTVQFQFDGTNYGSPIGLENGTANLSTAALTAGPHRVVALYTSDSAKFTNSDNRAGPLLQTVNPAPLTITADNQVMI